MKKVQKNILEKVIIKFKKETEEIFEDSNYFGDMDKEISIAFITERPYSIIAKLSVHNRITQNNYYVKIPIIQNKHTEKKILKEFRVISFYYRQLKHFLKYGVVKPVYFCRYPAALVTEEAKGNTLQYLFKLNANIYTKDSRKTIVRNAGYACGKLLQKFQSINYFPDDLGELKSNKPSVVLEFIEKQLKNCFRTKLLNSNDVKRISNYAVRVAHLADKSEILISGMYSDFCLSNILISENSIILCDFGGYQIGPIYRDVAVFIYSLGALTTNPMVSKHLISETKGSFLTGYQWDQQKENMGLFKLFQLREILGGLLINGDRKTGNIQKLKLGLIKRNHQNMLHSVIEEKLICL